jgi:hypothetical protein
MMVLARPCNPAILLCYVKVLLEKKRRVARIKYKYYQGNTASAPVPYFAPPGTFIFKNFHTAVAGQIARCLRRAEYKPRRCDLFDTRAKCRPREKRDWKRTRSVQSYQFRQSLK